VQLYGGIPRERITTIVNGIDPDRFQSPESRSELRQKLNLPTDRPVIISVGRLTRPKGYPYLLGALVLMASEARPLTLIVGDGPDRHDLESQITRLKLEHDVQLLGNRRDVPDLLAAADLFVLASLWEGLPLALLEAMASGLPSVVTAVGENSKLIRDGTSGLLVPPADGPALADAIRRLLYQPLQRKRMGQAAREEVKRRFSIERCIKAHENLYEELLANKPKYSLLTP
jgi:glycosyltransferase involved in cell wall biosynthesis